MPLRQRATNAELQVLDSYNSQVLSFSNDVFDCLALGLGKVALVDNTMIIKYISREKKERAINWLADSDMLPLVDPSSTLRTVFQAFPHHSREPIATWSQAAEIHVSSSYSDRYSLTSPCLHVLPKTSSAVVRSMPSPGRGVEQPRSLYLNCRFSRTDGLSHSSNYLPLPF